MLLDDLVPSLIIVQSTDRVESSPRARTPLSISCVVADRLAGAVLKIGGAIRVPVRRYVQCAGRGVKGG